jgi:hypothetical protein
MSGLPSTHCNVVQAPALPSRTAAKLDGAPPPPLPMATGGGDGAAAAGRAAQAQRGPPLQQLCHAAPPGAPLALRCFRCSATAVSYEKGVVLLYIACASVQRHVYWKVYHPPGPVFACRTAASCSCVRSWGRLC